MKRALGILLLAASAAPWAADVREIELRRLFEPTTAELRAEAAGRIYIYDGLRDTDIARALGEEFDRVDAMMFVRTKNTTRSGDTAKDPKSDQVAVEDDGC